MVKTLLLYMSILNVFATNAQYTSTPIGAPSEIQYGNDFDAVQTMQIVPPFQSVNTYSMTNSSWSTVATYGGYTPATVQSFYSLSYEEIPTDAPSIHRSPGVPTRAPVGEGVGVLLFCSALYTLCVGLVHHNKRKSRDTM